MTEGVDTASGTGSDPASAPPTPGGAESDIDFVDAPPAPWERDGDGYPFEAGLDGAGQPLDIAPDAGPEEDIDLETAERRLKGGGDRDIGFAALFAGMGSHLDELRRRLVVALLVFVPFFAAGLFLYQELWAVVIHPLTRTAPNLIRFQALAPSDGLVMAMRIAFAFAVFLSLPVWTAQIWNFVAPGLTGRERRWLYLGLGSGMVLFCLGAVLAYFVGIPFALQYLLPFNQSLSGWENAFTGAGYVDFVVTSCAGFGLAFETPLVMLILGWMGLLTPEGLREYWRLVVLFIFVLAAVMTPPDPFTQLLLALPMLGLFFLGYWLVRWTAKKIEV